LTKVSLHLGGHRLWPTLLLVAVIGALSVAMALVMNE
jgi:hypothetical protein